MPKKLPTTTFRAPNAALPFTLAAFQSGQSVPKGPNLPDRLLVLPWGESQTKKGLVSCNATTLAQLPANQAREKFDKIAFDFNHNTVLSGPEPKKVAGYGIPEIVDGEGVYLSNIDYTAEGREMLAGGHYPDISPTVLRNAKGEVIFLHSVAACRQGEIDGLTLFSASAGETLESFMVGAEDGEDDSEEEAEPAGLRQSLIVLLNALNPEAQILTDASDADISAAAKAAAASMAPGKGDAEPVAMSARIEALEKGLDQNRRETLIAKATSEGKVLPLSADDLSKMDLTVLSSMIDQLPVTVPLESRINGALDNFSATPGKTITPEMRQVAAQLGLKPEDMLPA